ncbi:multiple sugar transport system permease protein [Kaistia defluvii]|uniref:Multiple sugar transport system permease protein n=1 Tax=Kaistia defluvii TaxID=410841 RepID=A0ABV2R1N3_9HYPH
MALSSSKAGSASEVGVGGAVPRAKTPSNGKIGRASAPYLLILPSILFAFWIIGYPIYDMANMSVHAVNRFGKTAAFNDFANYQRLFSHQLFIGCLIRTLVWTVFVVGGTVLLSVPIALILNEKFFGRTLARIIIMLPWAVSLTMTGIVWRWSLNGQFGMVNATLSNFGLQDTPVEWLATSTTAFPILIAIGILVSIPFTVTVILGGLSSLQADVFEAAKIDGATAWQRFRYLTLPLIRPFLNIVLVLNFIYVFNSFPLIWVMTQGDPANSTDILVTWLYKLAFRYGELGIASALSIVMFAILLALTMVYAALAMRNERSTA